MNDPRRPERFSAPYPWYGPTEPSGPLNPSPADPAYADQAHYAATYGGQAPQWGPPWGPNPSETDLTKRLPPQYWQQDQQPSALPQERLASPPQGPKSPRWLWVAAATAVLLVVALAIALVIANGTVKEQTAVPLLPAMSRPNSTTTTKTTPSSSPSAAPVSPPTTSTSDSGTPTETTNPAAMQSVVYNVTGDGRAISVTYLDTGEVIQTEFNVALPWSKQVSLSKSTIHPASITIVNIGHNVTCSVTVAGVQVRQHTGVGITICDSAG